MQKNRKTRGSARRVRPARTRSLPPGIDRELLKTMSLQVATRGPERPSLTNEEIERALISGEHARVLETYFGEQEYAELTALAARAARRSVRGGARVLILPGILGSTMARMKGDRPDTIWVDFLDIAFGRLRELVLPDIGKAIRPIDAHPGTYLKLKLWLRGEGFDADEHAYDWRQSIPDLGATLKRRIDGEGRDVYLVAHSMGGLVARAAIGHGLDKRLKRLIMLGTPNYGSFAPVMVFRGIYRFLKIISLLDFAHNSKELAGKTFNTFPGLTEMMPHREKFSGLDLYDLSAWPKKGPRPLEALLKSAPKAQARLAKPPRDRATMIAGVDQKTTTGLRVHGDEFVFEQSNNGDGTVPLDFALLPGLDTWFIREGHGELPKNKNVWQAVKELIHGERVTQLERDWSPNRSAMTLITETEFEAAQEASVGTRAGELRPADLRNFMEEFAAGPKPAPAVTAPGAAVAVSATEAPFQSVVIGRRRQRRVEIRLAHGSLTQVRSRAYVLGLFQDVTPSGATLAVDAAMNGTITDFAQRRMLSNAVGEIFMLPKGRNELRADQVIFIGLGAFDRFNLQTLETVAENLARTVVRTDIEEFATILIGAGTGLPLEPAVRAYLFGFLRGLTDTDTDQQFRRITVCEINEARYDAVKWALYRLSSTPLFDDVEITLSEISLPPPPLTISATARGGAIGTIPTIYLNVRTERGSLRFCSSVLTSGAKATVISGEQEVDPKRLDAHLAKIEGNSFGHDSLPAFGADLARLVLPSDVIAALEGSAGQHLVVVHDAQASRIPWETLHVGKCAPALDGGVSRRYIAANMSVAKWLEQRRQSPTLNVLLVVNPTADLAGAELEGTRIEKICREQPRVQLTKLLRNEATRVRLLEEFRSGEYDVLHYAGHAFFDPIHPARSGLLCAGRDVLTGADLSGLAKLPSLVFFNACESARVRSRVKKATNATRDIEDRIARSVGLAEAYLRGGVANYLGTYWPVGDAAAETFASIFYAELLQGAALGNAVQKARKSVNEIKSPDWADYLQYGSFEFALKPQAAKIGPNDSPGVAA